MNCPNCGNALQDDAVFCDQCGSRVGPEPVAETAAPGGPVRQAVVMPVAATGSANLCPGCGAENLPGEMFCPECGTPLEAPAPVETVAPVTAAPEEPVATVETPAPVETVAPAAEPAPAEETVEPTPGAEADQAPEPTCAACGAALRPGDAFCFACGARLADQQAVAETPAAPAPQETVVSVPTAAAEPTPSECPACGAHVQPGDLFCDFCGAALAGAAASAAATTAAPVATTTTPQPIAAGLSGEQPYLVVAASGIEIPLPQGAEALAGREDPYSNVFPDVDLTPHGGEEAGVSRRHFKLTLAEGRYAIQDLGSTNYTWVNQQRLEPNTPTRLADGDEIRAGRLKLVFRTRK